MGVRRALRARRTPILGSSPEFFIYFGVSFTYFPEDVNCFSMQYCKPSVLDVVLT